MSSFLGNRGVRLAVLTGLGVALASVAPAACLYPEYAFNEPEPTGAGAGSTTGGGSTASTATGGAAEDCGNGVDDNGDQLVDCEDPQCGEFACMPEVPAGWTGHFALYDGAPGMDPGCPADFPSTGGEPFVGNRDIEAPPAVCTCSCGPAQGQTCARLDTLEIKPADGDCAGVTQCSGTLDAPTNWTGACTGMNFYAGGQLTCGPAAAATCSTQTGAPCNVSVTVSPLAATGGQCAQGSVRVEKPDVRWGGLGRACAAPDVAGKGCNLGQACLPRPSAPFESGVCISQDGDKACPAGAYTEKHVFFSDVVDGRGCTTDCACGDPSGGTCPTMVSLYSDAQLNVCVTRVATLAAGSCAPLTGNPTIAGRSATPPGPPTGGTCAPSGGAATGSARGDKPHTFCCVP